MEHGSYGVLQEYTQGKPSITPDQYHTLSEVADSPYLALDPSSGSSLRQSLQSAFGTAIQKVATQTREFFEPFCNALIFCLMTWFYQPSITKSIVELNSLVKDVLLAPDFNSNDLIGFNAAKENNLMDTYQKLQTEYPTPFSFNDKWLKGSVEISLPCDGVEFTSEDATPKFRVEFHYRKITQVIQAALAELHTFPFKPYWQPSPGEPEERIYSEVLTGDIWNAEYEKICGTPRSGENSALERFIIRLLIWLDSTSLTQFRNAELWPIYLYIGNQSKYECAKPSSFSSHHLAYLLKVIISPVII